MNRYILIYFGLGNAKFAPGTITSMFILFIWYFIPNNSLLQATIILLHLVLGFYFCYIFSNNSIEEDPNYIVIDEVVGMMISLFLLPKEFSLYILAFFLFRFFDIFKPSIIDRSQNPKFGIGIMLDDILSGILVLLILLGINI